MTETTRRDRLMRLRLLAIEALEDKSEAVREAAFMVLMHGKQPKEMPYEERAGND